MSNIIDDSFNWDNFITILQANIELISFESWVKPLSFSNVNNNTLYLLAPSNFIKQWVLNNYKDTFLHYLKPYNINNLEISLEHIANNTEITLNNNLTEDTDTGSTFLNLEEDKEELSYLNPKYIFDNFIVGKSNEFAYNAAKSFASNTPLDTTTLFLYGASGLGKTHLMHAVAWELKSNHSNKKCLYLTAEKFMHLFITALQSKNMMSFKDIVRNVDVLMIDDFQFMNGKESTQEEFFHTFNTLISQGKYIIFAADKSPLVLDRIEDRIRSRLQGGLIVNIDATTYELRLGILANKIKQQNLKVPKEVLEFLANTLTDNVRELEGGLNNLISYSKINGSKITLDLTLQVLSDTIKYKNRVIDIDLIQKKVAEFYKIRMLDLNSTKRDKNTVLARQVGMYIAKTITKLSLQEIGAKFGKRDHSTVLHAVKKIKQDTSLNPPLDNEINLLINIIQKS